MHKQSGYILIYVIGILIFLGLTALGVAYVLRINAQQVVNEKEALQNEYILQSAVQYTFAQLIKGSSPLAAAEVRAMAPGDAARIAMWKMGGGPYSVEIQGKEVEIAVEDAGDRPDLNALTNEELQRIFRALGAPEDEAVAYVDAIAKAKILATRERDGTGFGSLDQVLNLDAIPERYRYGTKPAADSEQIPQPGLAQLVTIGTGLRIVNLNKAPLQIIAALTGADAGQMEKFAAARKSQPLTLADAVAIFGEAARKSLQEGASTLYRIRVKLAQPGHTYEATAIAVPDGSGFKIQSYRNTQSGNEA
ncbi:MAG: hypothetical protein ACYC2R_06315 [Burkholderiales bacterium]